MWGACFFRLETGRNDEVAPTCLAPFCREDEVLVGMGKVQVVSHVFNNMWGICVVVWESSSTEERDGDRSDRLVRDREKH